MTFPVRRPVVLGVAVLLGLAALACSSGVSESGPGSGADTAAKSTPEPGSLDSEPGQTSVAGTPVESSTESAPEPGSLDSEPGQTSVAGTPVESSTESTPEPGPLDPEQVQSSIPAIPVEPSIDDTPEPYDPNRIMYQFFPGIEHSPEATRDALQAVLERGDVSQIPILVEAARFMPSRVYDQYATALEELTRETFDGAGFLGVGWGDWMEWLGNNLEEYQPPEKYLDWKISFMSQITPRFAQFLEPVKQISRIDPTEIVWGGVRPDGIPDLRNPNTVSAADAGYMLPDDRVVGVSINEEVRAYPLRILNPHDMINDVLGGEPISVLW